MMTDKVMEFKNGYSMISNRLELLKLEKDIKEFYKKNYFQTGLVPWRMKQWLNDSKCRNHVRSSQFSNFVKTSGTTNTEEKPSNIYLI